MPDAMNRYLTVNINMINQGYYDTKYMKANTVLNEHFFFTIFQLHVSGM